LQPVKTVKHSDFRKNVKNGDLIGTRASNNWMSRIHSLGLGTPIAHVGIAIVEEEGDEDGKIYMFESGAPRGAQLRDIDDYMQEGADCLWWRALVAPKEVRTKLVSEVEKASNLAYSWSFLKKIPQEMSGFEAPGQIDDEEIDCACSCGDLIAKVYTRSGIFGSSSRSTWLPMHFLEDDLPMGLNIKMNDPINVIFDEFNSDKRWNHAISKLGKVIAESV
jgi:hypothetical protein